MILNAFAILDAFVALMRLPLGLLVIGLGVAVWRRHRRPGPADERKYVEDRNYLLSLLALLLLGLDVAAWPLFYLMLQSYVREWPGVMCIYGVTRVGAGSVGSARFLPELIAALQVLKPFLVFGCGAWFVLYLLNRRTQSGPLFGTLLLALVACGLITVADAGVELTYLIIPKKEETLATGCCTGVFEEASGWGKWLEAVGGPGSWLYAAYYIPNLLMAAGLFWCTARRRTANRLVLSLLLVGACAALVGSGVFLVEVAAPTILHLPYHHCPYDLVPGAPEVLLGVALFLWGTFSVGWACVAGWLGACPETAAFLGSAIQRILFMGLCCYVTSVVMLSLELMLA